MSTWSRAWNTSVPNTRRIGCAKLPDAYCVIGRGSGNPQSQAGALRAGDMEIIKGAKLNSFELYNLGADLGETRDLASEEPQRLQALSKRLTEVYTQVIAEGRSWKVP